MEVQGTCIAVCEQKASVFNRGGYKLSAMLCACGRVSHATRTRGTCTAMCEQTIRTSLIMGRASGHHLAPDEAHKKVRISVCVGGGGVRGVIVGIACVLTGTLCVSSSARLQPLLQPLLRPLLWPCAPALLAWL